MYAQSSNLITRFSIQSIDRDLMMFIIIAQDGVSNAKRYTNKFGAYITRLCR